ncbi:MAG TPA: MarR family winged helix-turn-helix transcriptional regulator [Candidatus Chromulinivoraceae bacterium]|nr:MarR family winged helix-turn-helix transcriptional regulator [Candidatus Chromulinivoraceae bacterium]
MITINTPQDPLSRLAIAIFHAHGLLLRNGDRLTKELGQSSARWQILGSISQESQTVASIAKRIGHARQSVQRIADVLVKDNLATYAINPAHKRARLLVLTPQGVLVLNDIYTQNAAWTKRMLTKLDEQQVAELAYQLELATAILEKDEQH